MYLSVLPSMWHTTHTFTQARYSFLACSLKFFSLICIILILEFICILWTYPWKHFSCPCIYLKDTVANFLFSLLHPFLLTLPNNFDHCNISACIFFLFLYTFKETYVYCVFSCFTQVQEIVNQDFACHPPVSPSHLSVINPLNNICRIVQFSSSIL